MRKIRESFLREVSRFERCCSGVERSEAGLRQFHRYESTGVLVGEVDLYCRRLMDGKSWWEWTVNEYAGLYGTFEWPGWLVLSCDFRDDVSGLRQIFLRVRKVWKGVREPCWDELFKICDEMVVKDA